MFLKEIKSVVTVALQDVFNAAYPVADFQNLYISIEYPMLPQNFPGCWISFEPIGTIAKGGVDNLNYLQNDSQGVPLAIARWRGQGYMTFTIFAMTSLQRDRLFDEIIRVMAFNAEPEVNSFRATLESNPIIAMNADFDNIAVRGMSETPGTPWQTTDIVYEATLAVECVVEFASDELTQTLYPLEQVLINAQGPNNFDFNIGVPSTLAGSTPAEYDITPYDQGAYDVP